MIFGGSGKWGLARWALAGWVVVAGVGVGAAEPGERTVPRVERKAGRQETLSSSGQFLAHGPVQADRAVVVTRAEEVREELGRLLDRQERGGTAGGFAVAEDGGRTQPVVIHVWLRGDADPPVHPRLYWVDGVVEPVLGVVVARAALAETDDFRRELVRLLLVERIYRGRGGAPGGGRAEVLPAWLETGVLEAMDHVRAGRPSGRFAPLFAQGRILNVETILTTAPGALEAGARDVFGASACCLVLALLEQPDGPERFRRFLEAVPTRNGSWENLLVRQFPGLALSRHSLEKWWALQAAALATPDLLEPMTAEETDRLLARALQVRHRPNGKEGKSAGTSPVVRWIRSLVPGRAKASSPDPAAAAAEAGAAAAEEVIELSEIERIAALPDRAERLRANQGALAALLLRAFPLHRPIIEEYQQALGQLSLGKTNGLGPRFADLEARRRDVLATAEASADLLNWYEATQRRQASGAFDRYFKLLESPAPPRRSSVEDPIARSLDELEQEFGTP